MGADPITGYADFSKPLSRILNSIRLKHPYPGDLVASRDPRRGPFNRQELELIRDACESGKGRQEDRAISGVLLDTGIRPEQVARLHNRDLIHREDEQSATIKPVESYELRVQKIKGKSRDQQFHLLPLSTGCGQLLSRLLKVENGLDANLFSWIGDSFDHIINRSLRRFFNEADLRSPRLPVVHPSGEGPAFELMPVHARRFRYSLATDRIAQGDSQENVAAALGHGMTKDVHVYIETSPLIAEEFQRATDYIIVPLVRRMLGQVDDRGSAFYDKVPTLTDSEIHVHSSKPEQDLGQALAGDEHLQLLREGYSVIEMPGNSRRVEKSEARLRELVAGARRNFAQIYPGQSFDASVWDIGHLRNRPNAHFACHLPFTTITSTTGQGKLSSALEDALPSFFAEAVKSWVVHDKDVAAIYNVQRLAGPRFFWHFLKTKQPERTLSFHWGSLSASDFFAFEQYLNTHESRRGKRLQPNTVSIILARLQELAHFLASRGVCRYIRYIVHSSPKRQASIRQIEARQQAAEKKLPGPHVIETLADIYHYVSMAPAGQISDWVLLIVSAVVILMFTGLRIGELVTLPFDCEIEDKVSSNGADGNEKYCYGIRYWPEKTRRMGTCIRWISPTVEPIIRAAVSRVKALTREARESALVLEANPESVPLHPELAGRSELTKEELMSLLGHRSDWRARKIPHAVHDGRSYYDVKDVKTFLLKSRVRELYTLLHSDGSVQSLSGTLLIGFASQSHYLWRGDVCRLLVEPIRADDVSGALAVPRSGRRTCLFALFGANPEQRKMSITPHSFRHWLNHIAYRGGMPVHLITRYFGRECPRDTLDYLHFPPAQEEYRQGVMNGRPDASPSAGL